MGLSGYLVVARTTGDDVPVSLHAEYADAHRAAQALAEDPEAVVARLEIEWPVCNRRCFISIVTFEHGRPVALESVEFADPDGPLDSRRRVQI
jgi:hypothetical protein